MNCYRNDFFVKSLCGIVGIDLNLTPLCVYFETDTVLDSENPDFSFLASRKWRVRTMKMAGVYSEGLAVPIEKLKFYGIDPYTLREGQDLTEITKTEKYLSPEELEDRYPSKSRGGKKRGQKGFVQTDPRLAPFPSDDFPKTDEPNLKSMPYLLIQMSREDEETKLSRKITVTEKYDGMSATYWNGRVFSRNYEHVEVDGTYNNNAVWYLKIQEKYNLKEVTLKNRNLAIQGEIVGPGANKNRLGLSELDFYVFNIYDTIKKCFISIKDVIEICKDEGLKTVPVIHLAKTIQELGDEYKSLAGIASIAEKMDYLPSMHPSEGLVIKTDDELNSKIDPKNPKVSFRYSFKVVSKRYLDMIK